ncbi:lysozyme inhibitor LprI family protein [Phenylobacterium sp.]|uniref:lysozyme inhibitor LprI family protein n=1 Tax=Phenylobacterium sp. TaxID=1871053 RepID=UPI002810F5DC|nr:lysozyme inhibitor LprI family protein [Phenylobacterium sp.]
MPTLHQLDLSTLSGPELRSLLDSARDRGQAAQSYEILQEMARRREGGEAPKRRFGGRRREAGEPHIITLDLGDPMDRGDDPFDVPPPPELADAEPPLTLAREPEPAPAPRAKASKPPKPPKAPRVRRGPGSPLGFALGGLAGIVLGVGVGGSVREMLMPPPDLGAKWELAEAVQLPPPPPPLPPEPAQPAPEIAAAPQAETVATAPLQAAPPSAETVEMAQDAATVAEAPEAAPEPEPAAACASEPTAADRAICADSELRKLQKDLRDAYAQALAAHDDRATLRQRQLAWRDARNTVEDPGRLAGLYEARIRKLKAATAAARSAR